MATFEGSIIAYVGEDERYRPVAEAGIAAAKRSGASLILYDADAASRFASPLPTWWSSDGEGEEDRHLLRPQHLEAAGRHWLAEKLREVAMEGVRVYGWLPSSRGAKELAEYAAERGAKAVIIPSDLEHHGFGDWLKGAPTVEQIGEAVEADIVIVDVETGEIREPQSSGVS